MAVRLNRVQNKLDLLMADVSTGSSRVVLHEEDPQWINIKWVSRSSSPTGSLLPLDQ